MKFIMLFVLFIYSCSILFATIINIPGDYPTIQEGINASVNGDTVLVQPGTYIENINFNGKGITVASLFLTTQDTTYISQTLIDGSNSFVATFNSAEDSTSVLSGFTTVTNGDFGIYCYNASSPTISYNMIHNIYNGIHCQDSSSPIISNNTICSNGTGIHFFDSSPIISNNTIRFSNYSGISCNNSSPIIINNLIHNNSSNGINCQDSSSPTISKNTICSSESGIYCYNSSATILNNIIYDNSFSGVYFLAIQTLSFEYNLFWQNTIDGEGTLPASFGEITTVNANGDSCDVYYNLFMDPVFVDPDSFNFHIAEISPCIDAGNPDPIYYDPDGSIADIGAFYFDPAQVPLYARFSATPSCGNSPLNVQFTDLSIGYPETWEWDFQNDGTIDSYEQNPVFVYNEVGTYTVSLTVTNNREQDTEVKEDYITVFVDYVEPLINNNWTTFTWPYNAYLPEDPGGVNGHVGNACGPTSIARILHYWEFPINGNGILDFYDIFGFHWYCDLTDLNLNYSAMPFTLPYNATQPEYHETANLFLACGAVGEYIYIWAPNDEENVPPAFVDYFNFSQTAEVVSRWDYTREEWINIYKNELHNGRPIMMCGRTADSPPPGQPGQVFGHWWVCDGYNENDEFYINYAMGGIQGYYDIDDMGVYLAWNRAIIGLQPELNGKEIIVTAPNGGETLTAGEETDITWNSENVSNIKIEYTTDNGYNWLEIIASTSAGTGSYTWLIPDANSDQCKVRLSDADDINIYDKSDDVFSILTYGLMLLSPNGGEYFIQGTLASIIWENTPVSDIQIEYTTDNGANWIEIIASTSTSPGSYDWIIPDILSDQCKVRITDITNGTIYDESDNTFEIGVTNNIGGPYAVDDNTILLLQFEGNLINQSSLSGDGIPHGTGISYESNSTPFLGQCLKLDNLTGSSYVTILHNDNLNLSEDWTIEAWFYMTGSGSGNNWNPTIVSKSDNDGKSNYMVWYHHSWGCIKGQYTNTFNDDKHVGIYGTVTSGEWYHIAYIKDSANSTETLLIHNQNRILIAEETVQQNPPQAIPQLNNEDVYIGRFLPETFFHLDGYIDELRISNVIRTYNVNPIANFEADPTSGLLPLDVQFTDLSTQGAYLITTWEWDFDNDGTIDSYEQNPSYTYQEAGLYTVSLTVSDGTNSDTEVKVDYITVGVAIVADFEAEPLSGLAPLEVQFTDLSFISDDLLERTDQTNDKRQLMTRKNKSTKSKKSESEKYRLNRDVTRDIISWEWDFDNDGTIDSYEQNPFYTYSETGIYTVSLTVTEENGISDTETKVDYILVTDAGQTSYALQFDGTNDYVVVNNMPFPVNDLTIEAWIRSSDFSDFQYIVSGYSPGSGAQFRVNPDGSLLYGEYSPWVFVESDANSILPNVWTHVAVTKQGDDCNLYIDGLNAAYSQFDSSPETSTLHIGCKSAVYLTGFLNGNIVEVRMWTIARTQTEILTNMNNYLTGSENGLIAYWRMNEGIGQIAYDLSDNGNDGQLGSTPGNDDNDPTWIVTNWPYIPLQADFSAVPVSGDVPLTVNFMDLSIQGILPITEWEWDFDNDGTIDSYEQNPEWIYTEAGIYTVSLTVSDGSNTDTEIKEEYITVSGTSVEIEKIPIETKLVGNYPNPFNPETTISFSVAQNAMSGSDGSSFVKLEIYNVKGQKIKSLVKETIPAGDHNILWDGEDKSGKSVGSGIYFYKLKVNGKTEAVKKCLLLK